MFRIVATAAIATGLLVVNSAMAEDQHPSGIFKNVVSNEQEYAFRSAEYIAPNAAKFFPEDVESGKELDRLFVGKAPDFKPNPEILKLVRSGLRKTRAHRTSAVRWVGNTYIWNVPQQNPDAIELMYHAVDFSGPRHDVLGTRHYANYFGLSVTREKTPAILRTLVDLCLAIDDPNDLDRVAWGAASQRNTLLDALKPHLTSQDETVRTKAAVLERIFKGEVKAFAWATDRARDRAREKYETQLPSIKAQLVDGDTTVRTEVLELIARNGIALIMDDSFIPAFAKCAEDPSSKVRNQVTVIAGNRFVWTTMDQQPEAIQLMLKLSKDEDRQVRYNAVYYGLSTVRNKNDDVLNRLLDMAFDDRQQDMPSRIAWGLRTAPDRTQRLLKEAMAGADKDRAAKARLRYRELTGKEPPAGSI
jgi:hypothetical protein